MEEEILKLENYALSFFAPQGEVEAVRGINLSVKKGEILCIVGESGCGKSVLCRSIIKLLPEKAPHGARIKRGKVFLDGQDITAYTEKQMRSIRGNLLSMVFQDPMMTLNPTMSVGCQIMESILQHKKMTNAEAKKRAIEMLKLVGIEEPEKRFSLQPHFFSGGMRQRCVLAVALALSPKLLLADEPTTALDVTVESKILDLLVKLCKTIGVSLVLVSHDLGVVARIADRVAVMYAGKIVEIGTAEEVYYDPRHPYTWGLLSSLPAYADEQGEMPGIPGMPPDLLNPPPGDAFAERNRYALAIDYEEMPPMFKITDTHYAATWLLDKRAPYVGKPDVLEQRRKEWKKIR